MIVKLLKQTFPKVRIIALAAAAVFAACAASTSRADDRGILEPDLNDYRVAAEARLDLVFEDGTIYLYSLYGEDMLTRRDSYMLMYMDHLAVRIQFSRLQGKMLVAKVTPPEAASALPDGMIVQILVENLARPAVMKTEHPAKVFSPLHAISPRDRRTIGAFGISARVDLIPSDSELMFYFGQYTGLLSGDPVEISNALGKRAGAVVVKATTDGFVQCAVIGASAHIFNPGEMVIIRDASTPVSLNFAAAPNQRKIPGVPRYVETSKPKKMDK